MPTKVTFTAVRRSLYPEALAAYQGFYDSSYHNDVMDSVCLAAAGRPYIVWVDAEETVDRVQEFGWDPELPVTDTNKPPARFTVMLIEDGEPIQGEPRPVQDLLDARYLGDHLPIFETDSAEELVAWFASQK